MGNTISYIRSHGRRLLNRYNAQYRALKLLDKEKLPSAPRHSPHPAHYEDPSTIEYLLKKDLALEEYLKDVYIKSYDEVPLTTDKKNPQRPLPQYNENIVKKNIFNEPEEKIKGLCTLSQISEFLAAHGNDPVTNTAPVIAENYNLDVNKVENVLKYYNVFTVLDSASIKQTVPEEDEDESFQQTLKEIKTKHAFLEKGKSSDPTENETLQSQKEEKDNLKLNRQAVKNQ